MILGITAIVKNEALYIEEWLLFHHLQGVDKFFIYDNDSTDNLQDILSKYLYLNIIYTPWPGKCRQIAAYQDSINKYKEEVNWMAFIDIDEFLYNKEGSIKESITGNNIGVIKVPWFFFGSNNHKFYYPELVIDRFTGRAIGAVSIFKCLVNMQKVTSAGKDPHTFKSKGKLAFNNLYLNHYHTKSIEEYKIKCERGRADNGNVRIFDSDFYGHDRNEIEDTYLKDNFSGKIKELLYK